MGQYGEGAKVLYQWAIRKYAGEDMGWMIFWDRTAPQAGILSDTTFSPANSTGSIRVRGTYYEGPDKGKERSFESLWSNAIFELYNIGCSQDVQQLLIDVATDKISKGEYIAQMRKYESRATEKTRAFYIHVFLPWAMEQHLATQPNLWFVAARVSGKDSRGSSGTEDYWWRNCERTYDQIVLNSLVEKNKNIRAIKLATDLLEQAKTNADRLILFRTRGIAHMQQGDRDKAIDDLTNAIRLDSTDATTYFRRGSLYAMCSEWDKAVADYSNSIEISPTLFPLYINRGSAYLETRQWDKAIADCCKAMELCPAPLILSQALIIRGSAYAAKGDLDRAIADYMKALEHDMQIPGLRELDAEAYCLRGIAYESRGNLGKAIDDYSAAIQSNQKYGKAYYHRGVAYQKKGERQKAEEDFVQAKKFGYDPAVLAQRVLKTDDGKRSSPQKTDGK